jgi:hypothetical protein
MGGMLVFIFQSEKDNRRFGFTTDSSGKNLPAEYAPWRIFGGRTLFAGQALSWGSSDAILAIIREQGCCLRDADDSR